jgi:hypothetical protein
MLIARRLRPFHEIATGGQRGHPAAVGGWVGGVPELRAGRVGIIMTVGGRRFLRLDGSVSSPDERQRRVAQFNADASIGCFLLSTRVRAACP